MAGKDPVAELAADVQEQLEGSPPAAATRNINYDVHQGHAAQRPWARLEDQMGALSRSGFPSYEALQAALPSGPGNKIEQNEAGEWVRYVPVTVDTETDPRTGKRFAIIEDQPRAVALSRQDAKARSIPGHEVDAWFGGTWWRRGQKPETDVFVAQAQQQRRNLRRVELDATGAPVEARTPRRSEAEPADSRRTGEKKE